MKSRILSIFVLVGMPATTTLAQDWSELQTLTFVPVSLEQPGLAAASTAAAGGSDRLRSTGVAERRESAAETDPAIALDRIRAVVGDIDSEEAVNGENSLDLVPLLTALASVYREFGDYGEAVALLERAQQIVRRWEGLYSLEQAHLIEQIIEIHNAVAPGEPTRELETDLRELVRRNPGDSRNVRILTEMAGRQVDQANYVLVNGVPPVVEFNMSAVIGPSWETPAPPRNERTEAAANLQRARASYSSAMQEALANGPGEIPVLLELEDTIIDTYYLELMHPKLGRRHRFYQGAGQLHFNGLRALEAKLSNSRLYPGTPEAVAMALTELADWHLMFGDFGLAMDTYDEAIAVLRRPEGDNERIAAAFSPNTPVPLPAFAPEPTVALESSDVRGYVDVEIEINRFGGVRDFHMSGRSQNATELVVRRLKRWVYQSRFRPRYTDGQWRRSDRFAIRYAFGYSSS